MMVALRGTLIKITEPNDKGFMDVSVLPNGSDYVERFWVRSSEPAGQAAMAILPRQADRPEVVLSVDLRAAVSKGDYPKPYMNGRVESIEVPVPSRAPAKSQAA
jgi:hypothetical protein